MAKFLYRMQNILDIKYKLEEQAKQEYAEAINRLNQANAFLECLLQEKEAYMQQYRTLINSRIDLLEIESCKKGIEITDENISEQKKKILRLERQLELARIKLNESMKERKIHEKLKENQFEVFLQELKEQEAKETDELVSYKSSKPKS